MAVTPMTRWLHRSWPLACALLVGCAAGLVAQGAPAVVAAPPTMWNVVGVLGDVGRTGLLVWLALEFLRWRREASKALVQISTALIGYEQTGGLIQEVGKLRVENHQRKNEIAGHRLNLALLEGWAGIVGERIDVPFGGGTRGQ